MDTPARHKRRDFRTMVLYGLAILRMFRGTLLLLAGMMILAAVLYRVTPQPELSGGRPTLELSFYGAWMALFAQPIFQRPDALHLAILQSTYPLFGVVLIGEGIVRFALLMMSRRRGEKEWMLVMASTYRDHVILAGLGNLGYRVLEQLLLQKRSVVVIEKNPAGRFLDQARAEHVPIIIRDMKDDDALREAGIEFARSVILATDDDLANVETAIDARRMNPSIKVALRLFDQQLAAKLRALFAFDVPFSSSALAAPAVAAMVMGNRVLAAFSLAGVPYVAVELELDRRSPLAGTTVASFEADHGLRLLARVPRKGEPQTPPAPTVLLDEGDTLSVHIAAARLDAVAALARGAS